MHSPATLLTLAAAIGTTSAAFAGFNYDSKGRQQANFETEFKAAANLKGTDGRFTSARLYTMVQDGTANEPISAIPAAISTKTSLLLGLWASAGQAAFNNELAALKKTIDQYCGKLDGLVAGISVGSEDLYRISEIGMSRDVNPGASPTVLAGYIKSVREAIKGSCLQNIPIGHVDTWTAYANSTNKPLIDACDWLGMDTYPYFEDDKANDISNNRQLFIDALNKVKAAGGGKEVWVTETGFPVTGDKFGQAVPSKENAQKFWQDVGCPMFGKTNVWWYTLQDIGAPQPNFGVVGADINGEPNFDLSCKGHENPPAVSSSAAPPTSSQHSENPTSGSPTSSKPASSAPASESSKPTSMNTVPASSTSGGDATGSAPNTDGGASKTSSQEPGTSPSRVPDNAAGNLNSMGAAAAALLMAAALL